MIVTLIASALRNVQVFFGAIADGAKLYREMNRKYPGLLRSE